MKKTLSLLLSLVLMLSLALPASAAETEYPTLEGGVTEIQKYGNIVLDIDPADLKDGGYTYGDLLTVTVNGTGMTCPCAPTTPMWTPARWCCGTARVC